MDKLNEYYYTNHTYNLITNSVSNEQIYILLNYNLNEIYHYNNNNNKILIDVKKVNCDYKSQTYNHNYNKISTHKISNNFSEYLLKSNNSNINEKINIINTKNKYIITNYNRIFSLNVKQFHPSIIVYLSELTNYCINNKINIIQISVSLNYTLFLSKNCNIYSYGLNNPLNPLRYYEYNYDNNNNTIKPILKLIPTLSNLF